MDEARFLKKKLTGGSIDVHPTEKALVVSYEVEAVILSEAGNPVLGEKKACQKVIKVTSLNEETNIKQMAKEIIEKYKIIHRSKLSEVQQLLFYLQKRRETGGTTIMTTSNSRLGNSTSDSRKKSGGMGEPFEGGETKELANINDVEMYLEMLYDELEEKLRGTALILQLARNSENLDELCQNEILLGALARVLAEEWKESSELATNITYIFFCFSSYTQLHPVVTHFQVGSLCMRIIEQQLNRHDTSKSRKQTKQLQQQVSKQDQLLRVAFYLLMNLAEDAKVEAKMYKKGLVGLLVRTLQPGHHPELLVLVASFLKKLSVVVENKEAMAGEGVVGCVAGVLEGSKHADLLNVCLRLLLNLSFDTLLRQEMCKGGLCARVVAVLTGSECGEDDRVVATCLLYHLSMEEEAHLSLTPVIPPLLHSILHSTRANQQVEALALCINLSNTRSCALAMSSAAPALLKKAFTLRHALLAKLLKNILKHAPKQDAAPDAGVDGGSGDLPDHTSDCSSKSGKERKSVHRRFLNVVGELADEVRGAGRDEFSSECLGMLSLLAEVDFSVLLQEYQLVPWLQGELKRLVGMARGDVRDDQLTAELVMLIAAACRDESSAVMLFNLDLVSDLITLLKLKQEDDYMVLLIVSIFHHLLTHPSLRQATTTQTEAPAYLIDLIHDNSPLVRKLCASTLERVGEGDEEWARKIRAEKFKCHNQHWIEMVAAQQPIDHRLSFNHSIHNDHHLDHNDHHNDHSGLLLSRQLYHDHLQPPRQLSSHDSFIGAGVEDASALDHTDFYYGSDPRPPSSMSFMASLPHRFDDYDPEHILNASLFM